MQLELWLTLKSDATFGRGDGVASLVDAEIEHDPATGLPFIRGRTVKGLLTEECANALYALGEQNATVTFLAQTARWLFGQAGSFTGDDGSLRIGAATLPSQITRAVHVAIEAGQLKPDQVLESLTAIRSQTSVNEWGAPEEGSLRSMRVLLRETVLIAPLDIVETSGQYTGDATALLAACALGLQRGGIGRNRGRGRLSARLFNPSTQADITPESFKRFQEILTAQTQGVQAS